jgi:hypothetical protein
MLQHDYLLEVINQFVDSVTPALRGALLRGDREAAAQAEEAVAGVLDLDPQVALRLSPDSLVTMMVLSGIGDSLAGYVAYVLRRLADAYREMGEADLAEVRLAQAEAVEGSFNVEPGTVPQELAALDGELSAPRE